MHKKVVHTLGLNWKAREKRAACQQARFSSAKNIYLPCLDAPYPPRNHWVIESQAILDLWKRELCHGKLHNKRTKRHPIHFLDPSKLAANIGPTEDAFIYDAATKELICVIIRNLSSLVGPLEWVDYIVQEALVYRKPTRLDDAGSFVQVGFSAGARHSPAFDWVRNLPKKTDPDLRDDMNRDISSAFALFWNLCRFWLPDTIIADFDQFMQDTNIFPMNSNPSALGMLDGKYTILVDDTEFEFTDARLAPPAGNVSKNYARAIHRDPQPHKYGVSWTTKRNDPDNYGNAFYIARYGIRVANATNTLIAFMPTHFHGTSLPLCDPTDDNPSYVQRGLSLVTPIRLPKTWADYQAGLINKTTAIALLYTDDDIVY
ncbi:hypothetical protein F5887DRAFT_874065 [Amanita rubescens]|nr:hypothetical protein F5887DRAFT_874065 [Amanita rubescens]